MAKVPKSYRVDEDLVARINKLTDYRPRTALVRPMKESDVVSLALESGIAAVEQTTTGWRWRCDSCGQRIRSVEDGWVEWVAVDAAKGWDTCRGLRLVHHVGRRHCQYDEDAEAKRDGGLVGDLGLSSFVGPSGLANLIELGELGAHRWTDPTELPIMILRLHMPGYEQVHRHAEAAANDGGFEPNAGPGILSNGNVIQIARWMLRNGDVEMKKDARRALKLVCADADDGDEGDDDDE